jgi:hypothetical protein
MATVDSFNISAAQKTLLQAYYDLGELVERREGGPPVPTEAQTAKQAYKTAVAIHDLTTFLNQAQRGARYVMNYHKRVATDAVDAEMREP